MLVSIIIKLITNLISWYYYSITIAYDLGTSLINCILRGRSILLLSCFKSYFSLISYSIKMKLT